MPPSFKPLSNGEHPYFIYSRKTRYSLTDAPHGWTACSHYAVASQYAKDSRVADIEEMCVINDLPHRQFPRRARRDSWALKQTRQLGNKLGIVESKGPDTRGSRTLREFQTEILTGHRSVACYIAYECDRHCQSNKCARAVFYDATPAITGLRQTFVHDMRTTSTYLNQTTAEYENIPFLGDDGLSMK